ncbi:MAG: hypothetical protein LBT40_04735 [Deltaproteobacteria bacterium]|nr:hypothetical protein [Deltaproteobacteria bacterium]
MFMETAAVRAGTAASAAKGAPAAPPQHWTDQRLPPDLASFVGQIRRSGDERAIAATADAAACALFAGTGPERAHFFAEAAKAAWDVLGPAHPVSVRFMSFSWALLLRAGRDEEARLLVKTLTSMKAMTPGFPARVRAAALFRTGTGNLHSGEHGLVLAHYALAQAALEDMEAPGSCGARTRPGLPAGRPGRDQLMARAFLAEQLVRLGDLRTASDVLAPCLYTITRLPPAADGTGTLPWPPAISGKALYVAGTAAMRAGDVDGAEALFRRAMDALALSPRTPLYPRAVPGELRTILETRGDAASLREAASLSRREAELLTILGGPDSPAALEALFLAARLLERSGDADAAFALHREVLAARKRVLGPMAEETRQSRAEIRRMDGRFQ